VNSTIQLALKGFLKTFLAIGSMKMLAHVLGILIIYFFSYVDKWI